MKNKEYESKQVHKYDTKPVQAGLVMKNGYDQVVMENHYGMKISFEFPKETEKSELIVQEVKAILSDELRDSLRKNVG